jgi:hypothetical protein
MATKIEQILALMEDTGTDLYGIVEHVLIDSPFANRDDDQVLRWFPPAVLDEMLTYLREEKAEQDAESSSIEQIDLS